MKRTHSETNGLTRARVSYQTARVGNPVIRIDPEGQVGKRIEPEFDTVEISLHDARSEGLPNYSEQGIEFRQRETAVASFSDQDAFRSVYDPETEALIKDVTGAVEVEIFDHTVRTDAAGVRRPARHVHGDYSASSGPERLRAFLGEDRARDWAAGHYGIINVWRPVSYPVETAPLAFADPRSVPAEDWTDIDMIYPDRRGQISGLTRNDAHRWIYLSGMRPDEVVVFNTFDSAGKAAVAHSAVDLVDPAPNARPRQSIETRALVRYA